jgi:hypothetical protein
VSDRVETMSDRLDDTHANVGAMSKVVDKIHDAILEKGLR